MHQGLACRVEGVKIYAAARACGNKPHKLWSSGFAAILRGTRAAFSDAQTPSKGVLYVGEGLQTQKTARRPVGQVIQGCRAAIALISTRFMSYKSRRLYFGRGSVIDSKMGPSEESKTFTLP